MTLTREHILIVKTHSRVLNITIANNVSDILRQTLKREKKKKRLNHSRDICTNCHCLCGIN